MIAGLYGIELQTYAGNRPGSTAIQRLLLLMLAAALFSIAGSADQVGCKHLFL